MALLQTAILADKFTGLSCLLVIVWMIPNVVIEWGNPSAMEGTHLRISGLPPHITPSLLAPPQEWINMYPRKEVSKVYLSTLKAFVTTRTTDVALLDITQTTATLVGEERVEGDIVGCSSATAAMALGALSLGAKDDVKQRKVVLPEGQTKDLFQHAGLLDSTTFATSPSDSISILCVDERDDFQSLYSKVSVGGYIVLPRKDGAATSSSILERMAKDEIFHRDDYDSVVYRKTSPPVKNTLRTAR